jgi:Methylase involved in ubiquinone/menaquinone biosynthesis
VSPARINLPYVDELLAKIEAAPDSEFVKAFGMRHVHWGYYTAPASADESTEGLVAAAEALTHRLTFVVGVKNGQRVLDAGCGFGGTVAYLNEHLSNVKLTALNIDGRQLLRARERVTPRLSNRVTFVEGDACSMPFPARAFDVVLAVECIFHFPSRWRFFQEARRVLIPGGHLALSDFVPYGPALPLLAPWVLLHRRAITRVYGWLNDLMPCTVLGYRLLARATGFRLMLDQDITHNTLPTYPTLLRLLRDIGHRDAERATQHVASVSRKGLVRYRILTFEAL